VGVLSPRLVPHLTEKAARACQALIPAKQEVTAWKVPVRIAAVGQRANLTLPIREELPTTRRRKGRLWNRKRSRHALTMGEVNLRACRTPSTLLLLLLDECPGNRFPRSRKISFVRRGLTRVTGLRFSVDRHIIAS
jgi:hypothetical protein